MSVMLELSCGELVLDLFTQEAPRTCENFLKLCKLKYFNNCLLWNVQVNYIVQTGDPTATGKDGRTAKSLLHNLENDFLQDEISPKRLINRAGLVCMANRGKPNSNTSQFFITLSDEPLIHLDGKHTVFAEVAEGMDVLAKINGLYCDEDGRPFQDVRIRHTYILDDPYPDPPGLIEPPSPDRDRPEEEKIPARIRYEDDLEEGTDAATQQELEESIRKKEAHSRAIVLEMTGDIPDAEVKPPAEVLFVCKLNPVTTDSELEIIFSRFGKIKQCEIIRDSKTGDSLSYAFIEFETEASCIEAYNKMNNVLIDDRRIKVDFSQSVSKLWNKFLLRPRKEHEGHREGSTNARKLNPPIREDGHGARHERHNQSYRDSRTEYGRKRRSRSRSRERERVPVPSSRDRSYDKRDRSYDRISRVRRDYR